MTYDLGSADDAVTLELNGEAVLICEEFEVRQSILTQPSTFMVRLGYGGVVKDLLERYPPNTPFRLRIGERVQFCGWTDGHEVSGPSGGSKVTIHGRDTLAPLVDAFVEAEDSFTDSSLFDIVDAAVVVAYPNGAPAIIFDAEAHRKAQTGGRPRTTRKPKVGEELLRAKLGAQFDYLLQKGQQAQANLTGKDLAVAKIEIEEAVATAPAQQQKTIQAKIGQQWYSNVIKPELDRAGAALWADALGESLIISAPNPNQVPLYEIVRRRGQDINTVTAFDATYRNVSAGRYARVDVHIRAGGGKGGRGRGLGSWADEEMVGWGFTRVLSINDSKATTQQQATELARRKVAESRRSGWSLRYSVAGLTTPSLQGSGRVAWAPDTVVLVQDDELGISGPYYVESVERHRHPQTTTNLTLMRPDDVIFGEAA